MDVEAAVDRSKPVKRAEAALGELVAERDAIMEAIEEGRAKVAEIGAEIERVEREGDLDADVLELHETRREMEDEVGAHEARLRQIDGTVKAYRTVRDGARREALKKQADKLRKAARTAEDKMVRGLDMMEDAAEEIRELLVQQGHCRRLWSDANGERHSYHLDLLSLEKVELDRLRDLFKRQLRDLLRRVFGRGGREEAAA